MSVKRLPEWNPEPFDVVSVDSGEWWCRIRLVGELDLGAGPRFRQAVDEALRRGRRHFAVDASDLSFIDSGGLVALITARKDVAAAGGTLRLTAASGPVTRVLEVAGLAGELLEKRR